MKLLYKSKVEFEDYALNPFVGCSHGCRYPCYAMMMAQRYDNTMTAERWVNPQLRADPEIIYRILKSEIRRLKYDINEVHLCFTTDIFMYRQPELIKVSLGIIQILKENNICYKALTKGIIPVDDIIRIENIRPDLGLFDEPVENSYGISLVSLDESFRERWEPGAAPYRDRLEALRKIHFAGLKTFIYMEPFSPEDTSLDELRNILEQIKFVDKITFGSWQYNQAKSGKQEYPEYVDLITDFCHLNNIGLKVKKEIRHALPV